jgi:zinc-ribbon domain
VPEGSGQQQRYCTNCGHELREEDRFCRSCGRPVHQVARIPTPDADVPVPPLGGAGAAQGLSPQERDRTDRRRLLLLGFLAIVGLLLVVGIASAITGGGSGGDVAEKPKHDTAHTKHKSQYTAPANPKPKSESDHLEVGDRVTVVGETDSTYQLKPVGDRVAVTLLVWVRGGRGKQVMLFAYDDSRVRRTIIAICCQKFGV